MPNIEDLDDIIEKLNEYSNLIQGNFNWKFNIKSALIIPPRRLWWKIGLPKSCSSSCPVLKSFFRISIAPLLLRTLPNSLLRPLAIPCSLTTRSESQCRPVPSLPSAPLPRSFTPKALLSLLTDLIVQCCLLVPDGRWVQQNTLRRTCGTSVTNVLNSGPSIT